MKKLVRDKIPVILRTHGKRCVMHVADDAEYSAALRAKLQEEVAEFLADNTVEELADIVEVIRAIAAHEFGGWYRIETLREKKEEERGGFSERIIVDEFLKNKGCTHD